MHGESGVFGAGGWKHVQDRAVTQHPRGTPVLAVIGPSRRQVGVRLNVSRLRHEMACRGLSGSELAAAAGISTATMSAAMQRRSVSVRTLRKIAAALARIPSVPGTIELLESA
jgi:DNA-binding Xre family transcriptional regulator